MKTNTFVMVTIMTIVPFFINAQTGINTMTPKSTLEVNGTLRVDSTNHIPNPKKITVFSDSNTLDYLYTDTLIKKITDDINTKNAPDMIPWNRNTYFGSGGGYPFNNYYRDNDSVMLGLQRPNSGILFVFIKNRTPRIRDITSDFGVVTYSDIEISSAVVIGGYLYVLGVTNSGNRRINRYDLNNLSAAPVVMTFSGAKVLTNSSGEISMTCDGYYFYFTHESGINMTTDNVITKYEMFGTNFSYVSTTTLIGAAGNVFNIIVHPIKGYIVKKQFQPIRNFNPDGTPRGFSRSFAGNFMMNDRGKFYTGMTTESFYEIFYFE